MVNAGSKVHLFDLTNSSLTYDVMLSGAHPYCLSSEDVSI